MEHTLPPEQHNGFTWYGPDWVQRVQEWTYEFSRLEVEELERAAEACSAQHAAQEIEKILVREFQLPLLGQRLSAIRKKLLQGPGFALLRGLPVERYSEREAATIFCGIGSHLGVARPQNAAGHLLGHVRDVGMSSKDPSVRIYQTKERQTFHTDSTDIVGLLCLNTAKVGGLSLLVSSNTIFNEMRRRRPELLALLMHEIATDRRGETPKGMLPYYSIPVFNYFEGYLSSLYQRQYIESAQRFPDATRLTSAHIEALDLYDALANDPNLNFSMKLEGGDIQFVYNHTLLHDRTGFEDWPEPERKRHLLRLWLSVLGDRPLPPVFVQKFGSVEIGNRGGFFV
ncbi:MAG TPA: TauD/TfdA family dioxygenase [Candidatus Kapabacteria bacterium]